MRSESKSQDCFLCLLFAVWTNTSCCSPGRTTQRAPRHYSLQQHIDLHGHPQCRKSPFPCHIFSHCLRRNHWVSYNRCSIFPTFSATQYLSDSSWAPLLPRFTSFSSQGINIFLVYPIFVYHVVLYEGKTVSTCKLLHARTSEQGKHCHFHSSFFWTWPFHIPIQVSLDTSVLNLKGALQPKAVNFRFWSFSGREVTNSLETMPFPLPSDSLHSRWWKLTPPGQDAATLGVRGTSFLPSPSAITPNTNKNSTESQFWFSPRFWGERQKKRTHSMFWQRKEMPLENELPAIFLWTRK